MQLIAATTTTRSLLIEEGNRPPRLFHDTFCEEGDVAVLRAADPEGVNPGDYYLTVVRPNGAAVIRKLTQPLTVAWVECIPYSGLSEIILNSGYESPEFAAQLRDIYARCS
jgi:hypothetical protein